MGDVYRAISEAFHARVETDPILRPLFPGKSLRCATHQFTAFLVQFFAAPQGKNEQRVWVSLNQSHLRFRIGGPEREAWLKNMRFALDDAAIGEPMRSDLTGLFEESSAYLVNNGQPPEVSAKHPFQKQWSDLKRIDAAATAIQAGDASLIDAGLAEVASHRSGRSLLHEAAGAGCLETVDSLLRFGTDPDIKDGGGHTPLYSAGNECRSARGPQVVRMLVAAGADVNAADGVKHCTALHMAARRGNVAVAEALIACGADINARDTEGVTPLQRALNCRKPEVAALLRSRDGHL